MEAGQVREAESEKQKPLPFNFRAPSLQFTKDKSQARFFWQSQGQIVADHKQHMVNSIGKDNRTYLCSSWMVTTEAERKLQTLLADLGRGTSWLTMYKMTAKACEQVKPLPHNFAMPKVEPHPSDKKLARIVWKQMGKDVAPHAKHLKQYNKTQKQSQVASQYVAAAATARKHEALVTLLRNGASWLNMYQATVKACDELSRSRGQEELAAAAKDTPDLDIFFEGCILREAREDPDLHGLNFNLHPCDLLVPHTEGEMAGGHAKRFAGFRNLGNTCFVNATLQVLLHVSAFRSQIANPGHPLVVNAGNIGVAIAKLRKVQEALQKVQQQHASNKWSVLVPIRVLQTVFSVGTERYAMIAGQQSDAMDCFYIFCDSVGLSAGPQCWIPRPDQILQYPQAMDDEVLVSIAQLVHMLHPKEPITVPVAPQTFVLGLAPFRMVSETDAEWVVAAVSGWDDPVDMSPFCPGHS